MDLMNYDKNDFLWTGSVGEATNHNVYFHFHSVISIDGVGFHYSHSVKDDDCWITEIHYEADDGRTVIAYKDIDKTLCELE